MSVPALLVILMLGVEVFRPLRELRILLHQGMLGLSAARGIFALLDAKPVVVDRPAGPEPLDASAAFEGVTFSYPGGRRPAHVDLSFRVRPGERVAIVGPSGSGKSTVARLLLRFHDPERGRVMIGARDLRELSLEQVRSRVALVSQDTWLFHGTVGDNIRMGKPDASAEELLAAARAANAEEFIQRLPQGYDTIVGERGVRLSGGQRQRIAIARALLRDAPILVLDEALSSVDAESEALIQAALDRLMRGRTTLVFAHRLSSVVGADRILVLDDGRLVEQGTHGELIGRGGAYTRLMAAQAMDGAGAVAVGARPVFSGTNGDGAAADVRDEALADEAHGIVGGTVGWGPVLRTLVDKTRGYRGQLALTFVLGVARVTALIGVGVLSALAVRAVKRGEPAGALLASLLVVAPLAGALHWLESWLAHDVAYRLLTDMRLAVFRKLDALAPAYLTRRRSGDLVGAATHDVELIEYFFAHTITPALVAVLVPAAVLVVLGLVRRSAGPGARAVSSLHGAGAHPRKGADRPAGLARARGLRRPERARGRHRPGARRDRRLSPCAGLGRGARRQGATLLRAAAPVPARSRPPDGVPGGGHRVRRSRGDHGGRLARASGPARRGEPAAAHAARAVRVHPLVEVAQVGRQLADTLGAARRLSAVEGRAGAGDGRARRPGSDCAARARGRARGCSLHVSRPDPAGSGRHLAPDRRRQHGRGGRAVRRRARRRSRAFCCASGIRNRA